MDQDARRRIDNARDVLVGKIPDPKAQVEQITSALIYKFMDDMDKDAQGLGGKPTFFTNGYEKYAWSHILDPRLGGQERLNRYAEALATMSQNPHLPQLFRTIFKDAFLPYHDPTTLNLFLKEIDGFTYDHSENLGDAYEYLLSILGSQGKAGQFRTPRHIIDFMVRVVDPKKNETMLDPASGTAGFLISSYRHIIEQNHGHQLTPDEKERLAGNLQGYDIDPAMVRIGLVNMYLHSFPNPHIYEYDTLASEDRWDEQFDICMANPPFMTPKGGIRPHKRFRIPANRSEVLFVDYIAEHLKTNGRAAIIVPDGIVFKSDNAYKKLRNALVETWGLWAVVSLPAGVFHPYSGSKTSILLLDRAFAKKTREILFVKVQNDGFDLGAQRRQIDENDLPEAQIVLQAWHSGIRRENSIAGWVSKARVAKSDDYNLTGDRYKELAATNASWPMQKLGDLCTIESGAREVGGALPYGIPSIGGEQITQNGSIGTGKMRYVSEEFFRHMRKGVLQEGDTLLVKDGATTGKSALYRGEFHQAAVNEHVYLLRPNGSILAPLLQHLVQSDSFQKALKPFIKGIIGGISSEIREIEVPLPGPDVQRHVVSELDGYREIIDGARHVVASWKPTLDIDPSWPVKKIGDVCIVERGASPRPIHDYITKSGDGINWVKIGDGSPDSKYISSTQDRITPAGAEKSRRVTKGDLLLSNSMSFGHPYIMDTDGCIHDGWLLLRPKNTSMTSEYGYYVLSSDRVAAEFAKLATGGVVNNLNSALVRSVGIPLPPLEVQHQIVADIEKEEQVVESCRELVSAYEAKIKTTIARLWGQEPK
jgi:type I restriction enzyme M protein